MADLGTLQRSMHFDTDPMWEVARTGQYRGKVANLGWMFCRRDNGWLNTSAVQDVAHYLDSSQASINPVVLGTAYYLVSTSANDGAGGTGIRTMRVNCLIGATGVRTIRTVTLNGLTPVLLGDDVKFVQYMESDAVGSVGVAVGSVYCSSKSTAGTPTVAERIDMVGAGDGRSLSGRVMVPYGFKLHLVGWHVNAISANMDCRIRGTVFTDSRTLSPGFHFQETSWVPSGGSFVGDFHYASFPEGAQIKLSAIPSAAAAGNRCEGSFHFLLIQD